MLFFLKLFQISNCQAALPFESWWQVGMVQIWTQISTNRWVGFFETPRREGCSCGGGNVLPKSIRREWLQELTAQTQLNASEVGFLVLNDVRMIHIMKLNWHTRTYLDDWSRNASYCKNMLGFFGEQRKSWILRCSKLSWPNLEDVES